MMFTTIIHGSLLTISNQYFRSMSVSSDEGQIEVTRKIGFDTHVSSSKKDEKIEPIVLPSDGSPDVENPDPNKNQVEVKDSPIIAKNSQEDFNHEADNVSEDSNPYSDEESKDDQVNGISNIPKKEHQSDLSNANKSFQNNNAAQVVEFGSDVIFDKVITSEEAANLSILYESDELFEHSQNVFKHYVLLKDKYKLADADYSHFKSKGNAAILKHFDKILVPYWENWSTPRKVYTQDIVNMISKCDPLPDRYLKDLTRAVWTSPNLIDSPVWSLAPYVPHALGKILYSASLGAGDLMYFLPSKYSKLVFHLEHDSTITGSSNRPLDKKNKVIITLSNGDSTSDLNLVVKLESKLFDTSTLKPAYKLLNRRSMYSSDTYAYVMSEMFSPELNEVSSTFSQTTVSDRVGIHIKGTDSQTFGDAFYIHAVINDNYHLDIYDKSVLDMLISLLFFDRMRDGDDYIHIAANYIYTTIQRYFIDGMVVKAGVNMNTLSFTFSIVRRKGLVTSEDLGKAFVNFVESGKLIPVSTLQMQQYVQAISSSVIDQRWTSKSVLLNLANPNINDPIIDFLPKCSVSYKGFLKQLMRDNSLRKSDHYIADVVLPWQHQFKSTISRSDIYREMLARTFLRDDVTDYVPFFTKGGWKGTSGNSFIIDIPSHHRIAKYTLSDTEEKILSLCRSSLFETHPQNYIKRTARLTQDIPPVFKHILDGDS